MKLRSRIKSYKSFSRHTSAYVSIHLHTSAYASIRQHTRASPGLALLTLLCQQKRLCYIYTLYIYVYIYIYIYIYLCLYVCMYIRLCVCVCVCVCSFSPCSDDEMYSSRYRCNRCGTPGAPVAAGCNSCK